MKNIIIGKVLMLSFLLATATGCRSSKTIVDSNSYEERIESDTVALTVDSYSSQRRESNGLFVEHCDSGRGEIFFVDGGGSISTTKDGSMILSGIASIRSSNINKHVSATGTLKLKSESESKATLSVLQNERCISQRIVSGKKSVDIKSCGHVKLIFSLLFILFIIIIALKIWRKLKK